MYPNDPLAPQPSGIDYLNQIAPPPEPSGFDKKSKIIIFVFALIGIFSLVFIFFAASKTSSAATPTQVIARLANMQTIAEKYNKNLQSNPIQNANSSLIAVLTTANNSIETPAASVKIDLKKQKKDILATESTAEIEKKLDDALLNSDLDATYAHSLNVELTDTIMMLDQVQKSKTTKSMKEFCQKTSADLTNIKKQITEIIGESKTE
jgi:hypothetical protein